MSKSTKLHEGYLMVDHRASPGLTADQARKAGYLTDPSGPREGNLFESATMHCAHCGKVYLRNPDRLRERASCFSCNAYICDDCGVAAKEPGYIHESYQQMLDRYYKLGEKQNG